MAIKSYHDLEVWRLGSRLVKDIYLLTNHFPPHELYGLTSQIRRAIISVPSNIAEGHLRNSRRDYAQFISVAMGSVAEVETQLTLAVDLSYIPITLQAPVLADIHRLQRMLHSLRTKLKSPLPQNPKPITHNP